MNRLNNYIKLAKSYVGGRSPLNTTETALTDSQKLDLVRYIDTALLLNTVSAIRAVFENDSSIPNHVDDVWQSYAPDPTFSGTLRTPARDNEYMPLNTFLQETRVAICATLPLGSCPGTAPPPTCTYSRATTDLCVTGRVTVSRQGSSTSTQKDYTTPQPCTVTLPIPGTPCTYEILFTDGGVNYTATVPESQLAPCPAPTRTCPDLTARRDLCVTGSVTATRQGSSNANTLNLADVPCIVTRNIQGNPCTYEIEFAYSGTMYTAIVPENQLKPCPTPTVPTCQHSSGKKLCVTTKPGMPISVTIQDGTGNQYNVELKDQECVITMPYPGSPCEYDISFSGTFESVSGMFNARVPEDLLKPCPAPTTQPPPPQPTKQSQSQSQSQSGQSSRTVAPVELQYYISGDPDVEYFKVTVYRTQNNRDHLLGSSTVNKSTTIKAVIDSTKGANPNMRCLVSSGKMLVTSLDPKDYYITFSHFRLKYDQVELFLI